MPAERNRRVHEGWSFGSKSQKRRTRRWSHRTSGDERGTTITRTTHRIRHKSILIDQECIDGCEEFPWSFRACVEDDFRRTDCVAQEARAFQNTRRRGRRNQTKPHTASNECDVRHSDRARDESKVDPTGGFVREQDRDVERCKTEFASQPRAAVLRCGSKLRKHFRNSGYACELVSCDGMRHKKFAGVRVATCSRLACHATVQHRCAISPRTTAKLLKRLRDLRLPPPPRAATNTMKPDIARETELDKPTRKNLWTKDEDVITRHCAPRELPQRAITTILKRNNVYRTEDCSRTHRCLRRNRHRFDRIRVHPVVTHCRRVPRFSPRSTRSCW